MDQLIQSCQQYLQGTKGAIVSFQTNKFYLQTALLNEVDLEKIDPSPIATGLDPLLEKGDGLLKQFPSKVVILNDEDCIALVEMGLQREVRVALQEDQKLVKGGSFRTEEAIPPEAILFFPWGMKPSKDSSTETARSQVRSTLSQRLQFGGLEGLGRGWADLAIYKATEDTKHD